MVLSIVSKFNSLFTDSHFNCFLCSDIKIAIHPTPRTNILLVIFTHIWDYFLRMDFYECIVDISKNDNFFFK